jgi:2-oxo-3-hexenedioate decarboxylase
MISGVDTAALATDLLAARASGSLLPPPSAHGAPLDWAAAYALGDELAERRIAAGERLAGYKIGFTNSRIWAANGLDAPLFAPIYHETIGGSHEATLAGLVAPRIEPELVFGVADGKLAWYALGFELVQCHYPEWSFAPTDAIADFGLHAQLVVGERRAWEPGIETRLGTFDLDLLCDEVVVERGNAADVLGSPILAFLWLQKALHDRGTPLAEHAIVTTGTITAAPFVHAGERWTARATGIDLPDITVGF